MTGRITLRNGSRVIATEKFPRPAQPPPVFSARLPSAPAVYTLTAHARRAVRYARLSTGVTMAWRFRSGHTARTKALPLMAVVARIQEQDLAGYRELIDAGIMEPDGAGSFRLFTYWGWRMRHELAGLVWEGA